MRRSLGYQQQCYANDGMWMDSQSEKQSYAVEEEVWGSKNGHHNQFSGMHMKPAAAAAFHDSDHFSKQHGKFGGSNGMFQEGWHGHGGHEDGWHGSSAHQQHGYGGGAKRFPFGGTNASHYSNGERFNSDGCYSEEMTGYDSYSEEHYGPAMMKGDEMRYERHNRGGYGYNSNPSNRNFNCKPNGFRPAEWTARGV